MKQYEYMTIALSGKEVEEPNYMTEQLNKYGKNGWELVSVISQPCLGSSQYSLIGITQKNMIILKKQCDENEE